MTSEQKVARALVLVSAAIVSSGCFPTPGYDYPDSGIPTSLPEGAREVPEDDYATYGACANRDATFAEDRLVAVTTELSTREDGTVEVPISSDGCVRFTRVIEGGTLRSAEFFVFTGELTIYIADEVAHYGAYVSVIARWERGADGTLTGHLDSDEDVYDRTDDFREVETTERDGYYRVARYNEASREVEWRMTLERTPTEEVQVTEQLTDGTLQVSDRTVVDFENAAGGSLSLEECAAARTSCDGATVAALDRSLAQALARGSNCMAGLNLPDASYQGDAWGRLQALKNLWTRGHTWSCMPVGCTYGHWCAGCGAAGVDQIDIGFTDWSALPANQQLGTLFHEFMHGVLGDHSDALVNSTLGADGSRRDALMRRYADRVSGCEAYCFGEAPTRCSCAACLDVRTCDGRCAGLPSCIEHDCTGTAGCVAIMSEAVGAACITMNAAGEETATWSPTMAVCQMGCGATGGTCRSYSRSCEPGCE